MLTVEFWKKYFRVYDILNNLIPYNDLLNRLAQELDVQVNDVILDVGSGTGNLSTRLSNKHARVIGIDMSPAGIELHLNKNPNAEVLLHDLHYKLPFANNFVDKIVSNNVLYTISKDRRKFIYEEFLRVLKPGGIVVISNLTENFKPTQIYKSHLRQSLRKRGLLGTMVEVVKFIPPTVKIFYYNLLIQKENEGGNYDFFKEQEQYEELESVGFKNLKKTTFVYAHQAILNKAQKQ